MAIEHYALIKRESATLHQATVRLPTLLEDILLLFKTPAMKYTKHQYSSSIVLSGLK
jgi:hypothetical protein